MQVTAKLAAAIGVLLLVLLAVSGASAQSFQAQNVLVTDLVGSAGRSYSASSLQYWASSGQEAILYTVPYSATSSFTILEDFASGLRYVACADGCQVESLAGVSFPQLTAATLSSTSWNYGSFQRTFALPSGSSVQTLGTRPTVPALCATTSSSLALSSDPCLPYGLPCGSSCLCLGCTDGDTCTANDACAVSSIGTLTCTGLETCNRTTSGARTAIVLRHRGGGGGSGTAVALGVALGVGIGVPAGILLLFLCCALPLILLPLLWRRRERRPTVVRTTAAPVGAAVAGAPYAAAVPAAAAAGYAPATYMAGPGGTPVAIGNPLYAEPWRTAAMPQGLAGASGAAGSTAQAVGRTGEAVARDIPVYP